MKKSLFLKDYNNDSSAYLYKEIFLNNDSLMTEEITYNPLGEVSSIIISNYKDKLLDTEIHKRGDQHIILKKRYNYDEKGRLKEINIDGALSQTIKYDFLKDGEYDVITFSGENKEVQRHFNSGDHLLWEVNFNTGFRTDYAYDQLWSIVEIKQEHKEGHMIIRHENLYDSIGNLIEVSINDRLSSSYSYKNSRLEKEINYGPEGLPIMEITYVYEEGMSE